LFLLGQFDFRSCGVDSSDGVGSSDRDGVRLELLKETMDE